MRSRNPSSPPRFLILFLVLFPVAGALSQGEPLRVRRDFFGMHNLKDGGVEYRTGFDWTKHLVGPGFVFDWANGDVVWIEEAMDRGLIPCIRVQEGSGGDTPDPGFAGNVASTITDWKLHQRPDYADRYVYLQLWNEPSDPRDYVPYDVFADYMVQAYANVKNAESAAAAIDPDIAGTLLVMTPGQNNPSWWTDALNHNPNAAFAFDVWATHPYPESYPPHYNWHNGTPFFTRHKTIDSYLLDLDVFAQFGRRGFPVMITETAYGDHLGISYEGYPKTTRAMAADYNVAAFGDFWYRWPEIVAVHPFLLNNLSWRAFEWAEGGSSVDTNGDGVLEPANPFPQYTDVRDLRVSLEAGGKLAPARLGPYRGPVGILQGTVTRSDTGDPVPYANVHTDGFEFGGPTLFDGMYVVRGVPVGTYTLTVEKQGYVTASRQVTVSSGTTTTADFALTYSGKTPRGFYFEDCVPGSYCSGGCDGCDLYGPFLGQTFRTPSDVGFITFAAAKPNVGDLTLRFTIIDGDNPDGPVVGEITSYYLEPEFGGEMIGGEAPGDGIPVQPDHVYFLKVERTDGQGLYCYASGSNPYADGIAWVGNTPHGEWDLYGTIRGATPAVVTATGDIAGRVENEAGEPIDGAAVSTDPGGYATSTASDGSYTLADVPVGSYAVTASASGYASSTRNGVSVIDGAVATVDFTLEDAPSTGSVEGWVRDPSGGAISGALVRALPSSATATTDASGNYRITGLAPDTYTVRASKTGYVTAQATGVVVEAGSTATANLTLSPEAPFGGIRNGDFEGGFHDDPDPDHSVGDSWTRFHIGAATSKSGGDYGVYRSEHWSQVFYEANWTAGLRQQADDARIGHGYRGSVWVRGSSSDVRFRVGIDPTGGTDPQAASVVWSDEAGPGDVWSRIECETVAESGTITLFLQARNPMGWNLNAWFDDAALEDRGPAALPGGVLSAY